MNVKFNYLYRDAGNFKKWNGVIFSNHNNLDLDALNQQVESVLIDKEYFVAEKAGLQDLHFPDYDAELDHDWHEFYTLEKTDEIPSDEQGRDISEFLTSLKEASTI